MKSESVSKSELAAPRRIIQARKGMRAYRDDGLAVDESPAHGKGVLDGVG